MEYTFMFKSKLFPKDFFNLCIKRKVEIKKLDKLPKLDNNYLLFITKYQEVEIIPFFIIIMILENIPNLDLQI